jgi:hypothetical protein
MKIIKYNYTHLINDNVNLEINLQNYVEYKFYIVYFINCLVNENYFDWLKNQISLVKNYNGNIFIVATLNKSNEGQFKKEVLDIYPNVTIECNYENDFEYPGILKVWQLGQIYNSRNDIILYFHSKGTSYFNNYESYVNSDYCKNSGNNLILKDIDKIKEIYNLFPSIDKIGYFSGGNGWVWFNFWFVRGSYVNLVEKPIKTQRRHYYEDWLGRTLDSNNIQSHDDIERPIDYYKNTLSNCYNFFCNDEFGNIGSYFDADNNKMCLIK